MLIDTESIKDFLVGEIKELYIEIAFCRQQNIEVPLFDKGILSGKGLAYEKALKFVYDMEQTQRRKNNVR